MRKTKPSTQITSWDETIRRAQRLDPDALDTIVEEYAPRLYGFLCRMNLMAGATEDLVQEVFLRMVRTIPQYRHEHRFEAWLFRIAANLARDEARQQRRRPAMGDLDKVDGLLQESAVGPRAESLPDAAAEAGEEAHRLRHAIERLSEAEREVVLLRHYGNLSFAEIATLMEIPVGTALARAHRGLGKLREWMESEK